MTDQESNQWVELDARGNYIRLHGGLKPKDIIITSDKPFWYIDICEATAEMYGITVLWVSEKLTHVNMWRRKDVRRI